MRTLYRIGSLALLAASLALPATAGIYYRATTETTSSPRGGDTRIVVEAKIEGEKARIEFTESDNPMAGPGTYLLTRDGGHTLYLVNPEEKTYAEWDLDAMLQLAGDVLEGMGGLVKMEISEPEIETLMAEDGGEILGLSTRHHRFRTTYAMKLKVMGIKQNNETETVQDIWATDELDDAALGVWLRKEPPKTGNDDLDALIEAEAGKVEGFPLKTISVSTSVGGRKGKRTTTTRTETLVEELRRESYDGEIFELPAGFEETVMLPASQEEGERRPLGGLFGRGDG